MTKSAVPVYRKNIFNFKIIMIKTIYIHKQGRPEILSELCSVVEMFCTCAVQCANH